LWWSHLSYSSGHHTSHMVISLLTFSYLLTFNIQE
jgi:hypothetical protein